MYRVDNLFKDILENIDEGVLVVDRDLRITYWNRGAEEITGFRGSDVLGRRCRGDFCSRAGKSGSPQCAGCPLPETVSDGRPRDELGYVRHKDGRLVPVLMNVAPLRGPGGVLVGAVEVFRDYSWKVAAVERIEELNRLALLDPVTGIANRRHAERTINSKLDEMKRYGVHFALLFFDIDNFKEINDSYGHEYGDRLLKAMAGSLAADLRGFDYIGRWGGDEFVMLISNIQEGGQLRVLASRLYQMVEKASLTMGNGKARASVSVGATIARPVDTLDSLVSRADALMYKSKTSAVEHISVG